MNKTSGVEKVRLEYLSKENTNCLRGILSIIVVIHHIDQIVNILHFLPPVITTNIGYLTVGVFFFLTGYGLMASYDAKGENYTKQFLRQRIIPFYAMYLVLIAAYAAINVAFGFEKLSLRLILQSLFCGKDTVVSKGWYLQVSILTYVSFYLIFRYVHSDKKRCFFSVGITVLYLCFCRFFQYPIYYYQTVPTILLGFFWYKHRFKLDAMIENKMFIALFTSIEIASFYLLHCDIKYGSVFRLVAVVSFIPLVVALLKYVRIDNSLTCFLGSISFEIYVLHGYIPLIVRKLVENNWIYTLTVVIVSVCFAKVMQPVMQRLDEFFRNQIIKIKGAC